MLLPFSVNLDELSHFLDAFLVELMEVVHVDHDVVVLDVRHEGSDMLKVVFQGKLVMINFDFFGIEDVLDLPKVFLFEDEHPALLVPATERDSLAIDGFEDFPNEVDIALFALFGLFKINLPR